MTLHTSTDAPITCAYWDELCDEDGFLALGRNRYSVTYVCYTDGTYFYAENGQTGTLVYGGPNNLGGVSGMDAFAVLNGAIVTSPNPGTVIIKEGVYPVNTRLGFVISGKTRLTIQGIGHVVLRYTYAASPALPIIQMFSIEGASENVVIRDITFDMNEAAYPDNVRPLAAGLAWIGRVTGFSKNTQILGVSFINGPCIGLGTGTQDGIIIKNCVFDNIGEHPIYVNGSRNVWIKNNIFLNWAKWIRGWIKISNAAENIWIDGAYMEPNEDGLGYLDSLGIGKEPMILGIDGGCRNIVFENVRAVGDAEITVRQVLNIDNSYFVTINKLKASDWNTVVFSNTDSEHYTALIDSYFENMNVVGFPVLTEGCVFIDPPAHSTTEGQDNLTIKDTWFVRKTVTHDFVLLNIGRGATTSSNIIVDNCRFENWVFQVINAVSSIDSEVRNCRFSGGVTSWGIQAGGTRLQVKDNFFGLDITYGVNTIYLQAGAGNILTDNYISAGLSTNINPAFAQKIKNNVGYITENSGIATITAAATSIAVNHGCSYTPSALDVSVILTNQPTNDIGDVYVDTFGAAQFTIRCRNVPGAATAIFNWAVRRV